jgi:hypothetical protein
LVLIIAACDTGNSPSVPNPPEVTLTGISVTGPGKTAYTVGDSFSAAGLTVTAAYSDGSTGTVTGYTLSWTGGALTAGNTAITAATGSVTVTVTYQGKTAVFTITVDPDTTPPGKVTSLDAAPGNGKARLTWADPPDADLAAIEISFSPAKTGVTQPISIPRGTRVALIEGLENDTTYTFTVKAKDTAGNLNAGETVTAKPDSSLNDDITPPAAVSGLVAAAGDAAVTLTWTNPADADLASIRITWTPADGPDSGSKTLAKGTETYTVTDLTNGTAYAFTVVAIDNATPTPNESGGASANATPRKPTAQVQISFTGLPQDETITLNATQGTLSWAADTPLEVSVEGSFDAYRWVLDGDTAAPIGTGNSLSGTAGEFSIKTHELTVFVTRDGVEYAKSLIFTITY